MPSTSDNRVELRLNGCSSKIDEHHEFDASQVGGTGRPLIGHGLSWRPLRPSVRPAQPIDG